MIADIGEEGVKQSKTFLDVIRVRPLDSLRRNDGPTQRKKGRIMWACLGCPRRVFSLKVCLSIPLPPPLSLMRYSDTNAIYLKNTLLWYKLDMPTCIGFKIQTLCLSLPLSNENTSRDMVSSLSSFTLPSCPPHSPTYNSSSCLPLSLSIHREIIISKFVINLSVRCSSGSSSFLSASHQFIC